MSIFRIPVVSRATTIAGLILLSFIGCDKVVDPSDSGANKLRPSYSVAGAAVDRQMGRLSPGALTIAAALELPEFRTKVSAAIKQLPVGKLGVDMQDCSTSGTLSNSLTLAGQLRVANATGELCAFLRGYPGMMLYMNTERFVDWDGTKPVLVTAVEDLNADLPDSYQAYKTSTEVITLQAGNSATQPLLVLLPIPPTPMRSR